jgi:hypothetical protein
MPTNSTNKTQASLMIDPQITSKWADGRAMLDGRLACPVPPQWADEFGGIELGLEESDFAESE